MCCQAARSKVVVSVMYYCCVAGSTLADLHDIPIRSILVELREEPRRIFYRSSRRVQVFVVGNFNAYQRAQSVGAGDELPIIFLVKVAALEKRRAGP